MAKKVSSFAKARAIRNQDSRLWTPEDLLVDLLEQIRSGQVKPNQLAVHWFEKNEDKNKVGDHIFLVANCNFYEHVTMLNVALAQAMGHWS